MSDWRRTSLALGLLKSQSPSDSHGTSIRGLSSLAVVVTSLVVTPLLVILLEVAGLEFAGVHAKLALANLSNKLKKRRSAILECIMAPWKLKYLYKLEYRGIFAGSLFRLDVASVYIGRSVLQ